MEDIDRRVALALGLTVTAMPVLAWPTPAAAATTYGPNEGKELHPGIRLIELGTRESTISAYKKISMVDVVFQPKAVYPEEAMPNDIVCHVTEGELQITQGTTKFNVKNGDVYSCGKGTKEQATNAGSAVAVMRVINLLPA